MSKKTWIARLTGGAFILAALAIGGVTNSTAAEAACTTGSVQPHSVYNVNCTWAQHYVMVYANGVASPRYGTRVGACAWSYTPNYVGETGNYGVSKSGVTTAAC